MMRSRNYNGICGLVGLLAAAWLPLVAQAVVRHVPEDYPTIQAALDASANSGDEIVVAPGTYHEPINFQGKAVYLHSSDGPAATTIAREGLWDTSVVTCNSGEGPRTVLQGFTIMRGNVEFGGGMYNDGASPTVTHCIFSGNSARIGGGMLNVGGSPTVSDCMFSGNVAYQAGGGMCNENSSPTVTRCTFSGNLGGWWPNGGGAGMWNGYGSSPTVTDCTFIGNVPWPGTPGGSGGGMGNSNGSNPTVTNCTFIGNVAYQAGGGMYNGGMYNEGSNPTVTNCTFSGNSAWQGGAMYNDWISTSTVTTCILWGDSGGEVYNENANAVVTYSDVQGGYAGTGNIDADPLFVRNPNPGPDGSWGTPDDDFGDLHLTAGSPCIDAGDPNFAPAPDETDLDRKKRVWDGNGDGTPIVDMGAYEFGSYRYGDLNCDGAVNFGDIDAFVLALTDGAKYDQQYPNCDRDLADCNGNGYVDLVDIDAFVALLSGG